MPHGTADGQVIERVSLGEEGAKPARGAFKNNADKYGPSRQYDERQSHHDRRFVWMMRFVRELLDAPEGPEIGTKCVKRRQSRRSNGRGEKDQIDESESRRMLASEKR